MTKTTGVYKGVEYTAEQDHETGDFILMFRISEYSGVAMDNDFMSITVLPIGHARYRLAEPMPPIVKQWMVFGFDLLKLLRKVEEHRRDDEPVDELLALSALPTPPA